MSSSDHRQLVVTKHDELLCILIEEIQGLRADLAGKDPEPDPNTIEEPTAKAYDRAPAKAKAKADPTQGLRRPRRGTK